MVDEFKVPRAIRFSRRIIFWIMACFTTFVFAIIPLLLILSAVAGSFSEDVAKSIFEFAIVFVGIGVALFLGLIALSLVFYFVTVLFSNVRFSLIQLLGTVISLAYLAAFIFYLRNEFILIPITLLLIVIFVLIWFVISHDPAGHFYKLRNYERNAKP